MDARNYAGQTLAEIVEVAITKAEVAQQHDERQSAALAELDDLLEELTLRVGGDPAARRESGSPPD